jgi:hypothetical protein
MRWSGAALVALLLFKAVAAVLLPLVAPLTAALILVFVLALLVDVVL